MNSRLFYFIFIILFLSSLFFSIYNYDEIPEKMATHWNSNNEVDGYSSRFIGVFMFPFIILFILLLLIFIPKIDPLKKNILKFKTYFQIFILILFGFLFYIQILIIYQNLGYNLNMMKMIIPGLFVLFMYVSVLFKKSKPNWSIGIRTPWTILNENVWRKTHNLGSLLFMIWSFLILISFFIIEWFVYITIIPIILIIITLYIYSYLLYVKEDK